MNLLSKLVARIGTLASSLVILFATLMACGVANADIGRYDARIFRGDWAVAADSRIGIELPDRTSSGFFFAASTEYYLRNFISVGGRIDYSNRGSDNTLLAIGPSATWNVLNFERLTIPLTSSFLIVNRRDGPLERSFMNFNLGVGAEYFLIPSISVGPTLRAGFFFGDDRWPDRSLISIVGVFRLYF